MFETHIFNTASRMGTLPKSPFLGFAQKGTVK